MLESETFMFTSKQPNIAIIGAIAFLHISKLSDASIETMEFNNCREKSEDDISLNSVLAIMQEEARFSHKDR